MIEIQSERERYRKKRIYRETVRERERYIDRQRYRKKGIDRDTIGEREIQKETYL